MMDAVKINNVYKKFDDQDVLCDFSASFPHGRVSAIMGPSGCGKTTLLNIMLGLEKADKGTVGGMPDKVSCVFQEDRLSESFSALSNAAMCSSKAEALTHLSEVGLGDDIDKKVSELSGGMKRRVAIVRAILADADLLIMDEPFKGIDEKTRQDVYDYVKRHTVGKTVIFVTHSREEAEAFTNDIMIMDSVRK